MSSEDCPPLPGSVRIERAPRHDIGAAGAVEGPTVLRRNIMIVNLSRSGCLIQGSAELEIGDQITIWIPMIGARDAHVRRIQDDSFGCSFDQLLKASEVTLACTPPESEDMDEIRRRVREARLRSLHSTEADAPRRRFLFRRPKS